MIDRIYIASVEQSNAINAAADKECNWHSMASFYMDCMLADEQAKLDKTQRVDWVAVNSAILARWPRGLEYVKKLAHKKLANMAKGINPYS